MTITATVEFKSKLSLPEIFSIAQSIVDTPTDTEAIEAFLEGVKTTLSNPCCIGAKALMWVTHYHDPGNLFHVSFDAPAYSDTNLNELMVELIQTLNLEEWAWNLDTDDNWIVNQLPSLVSY